MKYSQIPPKFAIPWGNNAGGGYIDPIPEASQIGIANGRASLADGFPPLNFLPVGAGGIPPFGQDMNGILNQITSWERWQAAGGTPKYDAAYASKIGGYPFGAILAGSTAGILWLNTADDNLTNPESGGVGWVNIGTQAAPFSIGTDTGSANVMTATVSPAPTSYVDGAIFFVRKANAPNNGPMIGSFNGLANQPIVNRDGTALAPGQWPASADAILIYRAALSAIVLLTPATTAAANGGLSFTPQQVGKLALENLPAPTGAISLNDILGLFNVADSADRGSTVGAILAAAFSALGMSIGTSGYVTLPGGLIIQWITGPTDPTSPADGVYYTLNWPLAFPNSLKAAFVSTSINTATNVDVYYEVVNSTTNAKTQVGLARNLVPNGAVMTPTNAVIIGIGN